MKHVDDSLFCRPVRRRSTRPRSDLDVDHRRPPCPEGRSHCGPRLPDCNANSNAHARRGIPPSESERKETNDNRQTRIRIHILTYLLIGSSLSYIYTIYGYCILYCTELLLLILYTHGKYKTMSMTFDKNGINKNA